MFYLYYSGMRGGLQAETKSLPQRGRLWNPPLYNLRKCGKVMLEGRERDMEKSYTETFALRTGMCDKSGRWKPSAVLESMRGVGKEGKHLSMRIRLGEKGFDCIFFSHTARELNLRENDRIDLAFSPQLNDFRKPATVQLLVSALRHHRPEEPCAAVLSGSREELWALMNCFPARTDFVRVWRMLERRGFILGDCLEELLKQTPQCMTEECFCLCLRVFYEAGLIAGGRDGGIFGAAAVRTQGKTDLEATELMRLIKNI